jgi:hypothetical protein
MALQRFVDAQRTAFHKILKKYKVRRGIEETYMPQLTPPT